MDEGWESEALELSNQRPAPKKADWVKLALSKA